MADLPPIRRLLLEDFRDQKKWISPLLQVMNTFTEAVVAALTTGITLAANTTSDVKTITLSAVPSATSPVSVTWGKTSVPVGVLVGKVALTTGAAVVLATAVQVQWTMSGKNLQITGVVGITPTATSQYVLTLICIAG